MRKLIKKILALSLATALCLGLWGCTGGQEASFRHGKVLGTAGEATLVRDGEEMPVYEQLVIKSGDSISTGSDGRVELQLDDDKYLIIRENTRLSFVLEGSRESGAIRIELEIGSVHHTIENPLSENDSYEVHTAEAVTAVRGTEFDTTREAADGEGKTHVEVTDGKVKVAPENDGEEPRELSGGESATVVQEAEGAPHFIDGEALLCVCCGEPVEQADAHLLGCGDAHYSCDGAEHQELPCRHLACDGEEHTQLGCGHYACDGAEHQELPCKHYSCEEGEHDKQGCGHYVCLAGWHASLSCGNYSCAAGHGRRACGHCVCDIELYHEIFDCGHYGCSSADLMHEQLGCGNYACLGGGHTPCDYCYDCVCMGEHGDGVCNI